MKAQSTIEFLGSVFLFIVAIVGALAVMSDRVPEFTEDMDMASQNVEAYRITETMMSKPGRHSYGSGGSNWEKNISTVSDMERFGLANDYHVMNRSKLDAITGSDLNYSSFVSATDAENDYFFNFTWFPVVETSRSFKRNSPPSSPPIIEPENVSYNQSENRVHYGSFRLNGSEHAFLVAGFEGVYDTVYINSTGPWNFSEGVNRTVGEDFALNGKNFTVESIQNRRRTPGASFILSRPLGSFGDPPSFTDTERVKFNRYATLAMEDTESEVVRMEVFSW
jgi:hypothetical protein